MSESRPGSPHDAASLIELYYDKGWTDGLPVVPPSEESVGAMLAAAGLQGSDLLGEVETRHARITADKVAINAVMAGCRPEYMPVVVAAVKGLTHPDFGYHGVAATTGGATVVTIVNGPITHTLGINFKDNAFGPGFRPNVTIGRALRLLMMNAINTRPGKLDRATLGNPGKIAFCFAEDEGSSPWEPLHVERGFRPDESTVTLFPAESVVQTYNQLSPDPEPVLMGLASACSHLGAMTIMGQQDVVVVLAGEHMQVMRESGWTKQQVKQCLYDHARQTVADLKLAGRMPGEVKPGDETTWRHATAGPDQFIIVPAGGDAGSFSACLPGWGGPQYSRTLTTPIVLP